MLLLLVRHAIAAERDETRFPDDSLRPLVPKGRRIQTRMSRRLVKLGVVPTAIFASPWRRAWQTAGILAEVTGVGKRHRVTCPPLARDPALDTLAEAVGPREAEACVALVGHEPWMSELSSLLLTGSPTRLAVDFAKSGVLGIDTPAIVAAAGRLAFYLVPGTR